MPLYNDFTCVQNQTSGKYCVCILSHIACIIEVNYQAQLPGLIFISVKG